MVVRGQIINTSKRNSNRKQVFTSWSRRRERSEHASEASSTRPEVYSSRSEYLPEAPKCIHPGMYDCLEYNGTYRRTKRVDNGVLDTLKRHLWTNRLEGWRKKIYTPEQISQDPHAMQVYVQLKRIMQTTNGRGRGWISSWSGILQKTRGVMGQKQSSWNESIIYSIHFKGKVINIFKMWQLCCGISPTFLSFETHQGEIFSYVTSNWISK